MRHPTGCARTLRHGDVWVVSSLADALSYGHICCYFRDTVWGLLTGQASENTPSLVMHEVREIETWILRLLSAPVPVPGRTRVEVRRKVGINWFLRTPNAH